MANRETLDDTDKLQTEIMRICDGHELAAVVGACCAVMVNGLLGLDDDELRMAFVAELSEALREGASGAWSDMEPNVRLS